MTEEDAECQCNLMILGELYRNRVIEKTEIEVSCCNCNKMGDKSKYLKI